jgi:WD40 repeat protein/energy-coupling factor transporter ATP-binding protein EcfA2
MSAVKPGQWDVFLSHNSRDKLLAEGLARQLLERGLRPWFDKWDLVAGEEWLPAIDKAVESLPCMVVCIGPAGWSPVQDSEVQSAQYRAMRDLARRVIPVLLPGAGSEPELRGLLGTRTWIDLRQHSAEELHRLCEAIRGRPPGPALLPSPDCPYRGLEAFEREHARMFFGRSADAAHLLDRLRREQRMLFVIGPSGSGKSSLVLAGLLPAVVTGELNGSYDWRVVTLRPGARPCHSLALALGQLEPRTGAPIDPSHLQARRRNLLDSEETLTDHADVALSMEPRSPRLLLVIDQLEEVFSQCQDARDREAFLGNLLRAATVPGGRVHLVATLRSDFLGRCQEQPRLAEHLNGATFLMRPLTESELRETVTLPALLSGLRFEPGLAEALVSAVRAQPGNLPLLQFALLQLWMERRDNELTWEAYHRIGELRGAIARRAEQVFTGLPEPRQQAARHAFKMLIIAGEETGYTRRRASRGALSEAGAEVPGILDRFVAARLLVVDGDDVELAHEALVQGWERLRGWLNEDREVLLLRQEVTRATETWRRSGHAADELWRGTRLARARELESSLAPMLTPEERTFLCESGEALLRAEAAAEEQRRREAELTRSSVARMLAMRSAHVRSQQPILSLLLALEAVRHHANDETRSELYAALLGSPRRGSIPLGASTYLPGVYFQLSPDGTKLLAVTGREAELLSLDGTRLATFPVGRGNLKSARFSPDGEAVAIIPSSLAESRPVAAWLFNLRGELLATLEDKGEHAPTSCARFSPDGQHLLTSRADGKVRLWRRGGELVAKVGIGRDSPYGWFSPDGTQVLLIDSESRVAALWSPEDGGLRKLQGHEHRIIYGEWSPDGRYVVTAARDNTARVWDREGTPVAALDAHTLPLTRATFSPSGEEVLTVSEDGDARVWSLKGEMLRLLSDAKMALANGSWSPGGRHFLTETGDGTVRIYRADGRLLTTLWRPDAGTWMGRTSFPAWSPDGSSVLTSFGSHPREPARIAIWAVEPEPARALREHQSDVVSVAPQPRGTRLLTVSRDCVCLWNGQGTLLRRLEPAPATSGSFRNAHWAPGGDRFLTHSYSDCVRVWDRDGGFLFALEGAEDHQHSTNRASFSPDGSRLLTVSTDGSARLWGLDGREVLRLGDHYWGVEYGVLSPSGDQALTVNAHSELFVWDLRPPFPEISDPRQAYGAYVHENLAGPPSPPGSEDGGLPAAMEPQPPDSAPYKAARLLFQRPSHFAEMIEGAHFLPGGDHVLLTSWGAPCVSLSGGAHERPRYLAPERDVTCCVVNPEGTRVYLGYADGAAEVLSPEGTVLLRLHGHEKAVRWMGSAPDGSRLFTASEDGTICLWARDGSRMATLRGHLDPLTDVALLGDGQTLVTAAGPVVWLWPATEQGLLELARSRAPRELTPEERERYLVQSR